MSAFVLPLLLASALVRAAPPSAAPSASGPAPIAVAIEKAWEAQDVAGYLAHWFFADAEAKAAEREFALSHWQARGESHLTLHYPASVAETIRRVASHGELVTVNGPWGHVEQVVIRMERRPEGWRVVSRQSGGEVDGLVHISLDPKGSAANGHVLHLPDCELEMTTGTVFFSPASIDRTVLVFVGSGRVRFRPSPRMEQEQLRKYYGQPEIDAPLKLAFLRIAPADLDQWLTGPELRPDPEAGTRWPAARRFFDEQADSAYLLDAAVRGSPWWTVPPAGDAYAVFDYGSAPLSLSVSNGGGEGISLFDRTRQRQICLYPRPGRPRDFDEDADRHFDLLHTDLKLTLAPETDTVQGEATLRLAVLGTGGTIRLRLNDALTVDQISSEGKRHLFFRLRKQNAVLVAVGAPGASSVLTLTVRYHGVLKGLAFDREPVGHEDPPGAEFPFKLLPPTIYAQTAAWYPQPEKEDFATAVVEVDHPSGYVVVGPVRRTTVSAGPGRTLSRFVVDQPVKQITLAVGHLVEAARRDEAGVAITAYAVPRLKRDAVRAAETTRSILRLYTTLFGPAPYKDLQLVLMEGDKPGGHSPPGLVLLTSRPPVLAKKSLLDDPANFSEIPGFFLAHEVAHQWWGDAVSGQSYHDRWISEATAHYAAALWVRDTQGEAAFASVMREMTRWALDKNEAGPIFLGHRLGHLERDARLMRAIVYDKGACVWHMLRRAIGDEAFVRGLTRYQEAHRFAKAGTPQIEQALSEAAGVDLHPYFESWIYGTELPVVSLSSRTAAADAGFRTTIHVEVAPPLPGRVPVDVVFQHGGERETRTLDLGPQGGDWQVETDYRPERVRINDDGGLLARVRG